MGLCFTFDLSRSVGHFSLSHFAIVLASSFCESLCVCVLRLRNRFLAFVPIVPPLLRVVLYCCMCARFVEHMLFALVVFAASAEQIGINDVRFGGVGLHRRKKNVLGRVAWMKIGVKKSRKIFRTGRTEEKTAHCVEHLGASSQ